MLTSNRFPFPVVLILAFCFGLVPADGAGAAVVINELHTNPDVKTEIVEFIELHNTGPAEVSLAGWQFSEGVFYTFPAGAKLPAGGYIIVVRSPDHIRAKWSVGRVGIPDALIFGPWGGALDAEGERVVLCDAAGAVVDEVEYRLGFPWPTVGDAIPPEQPGTGPSLQLVNPQFDNNLGGSWRSAPPTPAAVNGVYANNIPPHIRQVRHSPKQPKTGEVVTITAKVTDPDGVQSVRLQYQVVQPGAYVARFDAQYQQAWTTVEMRDDGLGGDVAAGDDVYMVEVPAPVQMHRRLVRYRIIVADRVGYAMTVPYADDPQPNFAYFVYDGVPAWRGAVQPGVTPVTTFSAEVMRSLPVYHLISKKSDVENATWFSKYTGNEYRWWGTLIYDGEVYDHVRYRMRGGVWRYSMGKHMFKWDFNRGHYFQARDDYGRRYDTTWDKLNFSACIQQGSFGQRGEQGMFEAVSFRLFNMAGCPASKTNYVHFRIIDETFEDGERNAAHRPLTTSGTQYDGDFWGLYMTIEQMDGRFLEEHGLPDGNLYKMDNNNDELNNQGPTQPSNWSDLNQFVSGYRSANESWWRQNVNLDVYYPYYAIYQAIHHGDITEKNWFLYHHPETNQWWQLPWDLDLTWTTYYGSNDPGDPFSRSGLLGHAALSMENKNRLREIIDLLFNPEQTSQLIDEYAAIIDDPAGGPSMVDADRCMWDYHWAAGTGAYPTYIDRDASSKAGQGRFYQAAANRGYPRTFEGMVRVMKDYVVERMSHLNGKAADSAIPNKPTVTSASPAGFPINALTFKAGPFSDPQGSGTFGAIKWRIAEVTSGAYRREPGKYEIDAAWESDEIKRYESTIKIPATAVRPGRTYRVRCRMKDSSGRWSHWSDPVQFMAGEPVAAGILADLRVTEVMYNPAPLATGNTDNDEFEFIELKNTGDETLDLSTVSFTGGIAFDFAAGSVKSLGPGKFVLVVKNRQAFLSRYGSVLAGVIAGQFEGKLANEGENILLVDLWNGTIAEFEYGDGRGWPLAADGGGHSLVPLDSAMLGQPKGSLNYPGNWRASAFIGGSPGKDDPAPAAGVLLNEFMANTIVGNQASNDWVELYNPTNSQVSLAGWYLSDDVDRPKKWALPPVSIPAQGRLSFDETAGFGIGAAGFGLSHAGEQLLLSHLPGTSQNRVADAIRFKAQEPGVSFGRYPDGGAYWFRLEPTRGAANKDPKLDVVIGEIMYHPADTKEEYVELYNPTTRRIDLGAADVAWRLDGAVEYLIPVGVSIPASGRLVIVGFDPTVETSRLNAFVAAYNTGPLTAGTTILGPWTGNLSNRGERLALEKSLPSGDPADPVAWSVVDEAIYSDVAPWPAGADDGQGNALHRIQTDATHSGNDPTNWKSAPPTPGKP